MPEPTTPGGPGIDELAAGIRAGDRILLARAITLVESRRPEGERAAQELLSRLRDATGGAHRVGVSGPPGVGKSTLIDALGMRLAEGGTSVAVLAVDPSSTISGGSVLGDKSRMHRLAQHPRAFIRPSPTSLTLGGVARRTRETMLLCEAAGYEVVLVETVGVGQSEVLVADMVDTFLVLALPGSGDELQGIKKGILELADVVAVNKTDGEREPLARETQAELSAALRYLPARSPHWRPRALCVSATTGAGLSELWTALTEHRAALLGSGELDAKRSAQLERWVRVLAEEYLLQAFRADPAVAAALERDRSAAGPEDPPASELARRLVARFRGEE
ncbi:MAG: methylmalonyl Co-A mutase-associated GTPase MeaB [Thermoanaerobaculia bacterium]